MAAGILPALMTPSHHQDLDTVSERLDTSSMARLLSRHWIRDRVAEEASWS